MIIVSQKNKIINYDNIVEISVKDLTIYDYECFGIIAETVNNKEKELGTYDTEERAKEVFKEIQVASSDFKYFEIMKRPETAQNVIKRYGTWNIYKMPEE